MFHGAMLQQWNTALPSQAISGHGNMGSVTAASNPEDAIDLKGLIRDPNVEEQSGERGRMPLALGDAMKGVGMFQTVGVPILGLIENMSYFLCPCCGTRTDIFDHGGTRRASETHHVPFLGEIPLDAKIRVSGDQGIPIVVAEPDSVYSAIFADMCKKLVANIRADDTARRAKAVLIKE